MTHDTPDRPEPPEEGQEPDGIETCPCGRVIIIDDTDDVSRYIEESNLDICDCPPEGDA